MDRRATLKVAAIAVGLALMQGLAVLVYRRVEAGRRAAREAPFSYERLPNRPAPDLKMTTLEGTTRRLVDLEGKAVLLHFWATWCPPCRDELPGLLALGSDPSLIGQLEVVAVSLDSEWGPISEFFGGRAVPAEVVRDASGASKAGYDLMTLPDTYLIGGDGSIRLRFGGARDWRSPEARRVLLDHLK
jgi:thiol-disulfide isomerase/thioredoxin